MKKTIYSFTTPTMVSKYQQNMILNTHVLSSNYL